MLTLFQLYRKEDVSGVSGTGVVAEGMECSDGVVFLRWLTPYHGDERFDSVVSMMAVHGHGGKTEMRLLSIYIPQKEAEE